MDVDILFTALVVSAVITELVTEVAKRVLSRLDVKYPTDVVAGIVSIVVSILLIIGYLIYTGESFTGQLAVLGIALIILSWLCATVGYDKVLQTIKQIKKSNNEEG